MLLFPCKKGFVQLLFITRENVKLDFEVCWIGVQLEAAVMGRNICTSPEQEKLFGSGQINSQSERAL